MFREKVLRNALRFYVGEHVLNSVLKYGKNALKLGGGKRNMTVYFQDILGFTTISEPLAPEDVVLFLNEYLTVMTQAVIVHNGIVGKYMGDEIMAFWGSNGRQDHAAEACECALKCIQESRLLSEKRAEKGVPSLRVTIGINTGPVLLGNFGAIDRFEYTVLGDHVNLTSRLEGANKSYGTQILVSEYTKMQLGERFKILEVATLKVKGKPDQIKLYTLEPISS